MNTYESYTNFNILFCTKDMNRPGNALIGDHIARALLPTNISDTNRITECTSFSRYLISTTIPW